MKQFKKSCSGMIEKIVKGQFYGLNKISVKKFLSIFLLVISLWPANSLKAQNTEPPFCSTCTAEDIKMVGVDIITGNNGNCYNPGDNVSGFFRFKLDVTAKQRYGLVIYFEIWVDGEARGKFYTCMDKIFDQGYQEIESFNGNKFPVPAGIPPGQIMVKNMFTAWDNQYPDLVCGKTSFTDTDGDATTSLDDVFAVDCFKLSPKCKFYAEVPLVNLAVKPSVSLASVMPALCPGGTSVALNFTNRSSGADEYQISFDNAARTAGFSNIAYQLLGASPISIAVPANAASAVYNGVLTIRNTISGCESQPYNFTITVKDNVFVATHPAVNDTYCTSGPGPDLNVVAGGEQPYSYQWYQNNSASSSGGSAIAGATAAVYTPAINEVGNSYYYVQVNGGCGPAVLSNPVTVVVNKNTAILDGGQPLSGAAYCKGATADLLSVSADGANVTYQWYHNSSNDNTNGNIINGATASSYRPSTSVDGIIYYYVVVSGKCGSVTSSPASVFVKKTTIISTHPSGNTYCTYNGASALSVVASGKNLTYQWYSNSSNSTAGGISISGATNASYTPPTSVDGVNYYYVVVGGACGTVTSGVSSVIVYKLTSISSHPVGGTYCPTSSPSALMVTADGTTLTYQWYVNNSNSTAGASAISGATNASYTPSVSQAGTKYYYVIVSGSCGNVNSEMATIVVDPSTQITTQPLASTTYCKGAGASALSVVASGKNLTYQWYSSGTNSTVGGSAISGETNTSYTPPTVTNGKFYYYVVVSGTCGSVSSSISTITVNKITEIKTQPSNTYACIGGYVSPLFIAASGTSLTYQWYSNTSNTNVGGTLVPGATNFSYTPPTSVGSPGYYYIVVAGACGSVTSTTVSVILSKNTEIKNTLAGAEYCQDATATAFSITADGEQLTYQWYANTIPSDYGSSTLADQTNASYTPPTNIAGTKYYYVVVTGTCGQSQLSNYVSVLVKGKPSIQTQPAGNTYCKDASATNLSVVASGTGLTYQWYSNTINGTVGATALGTSSTQAIPTSVVGTVYYYVVVSGTCSPSVMSDIVSIDVIEKASITKQPSGYSLCRTAEGKELSVEATGVGKTYQWYKSFTGTDGTFTSIQGATNSSYMPDVSVVGTLYYYVQVSSASCGSVNSNIVSVMVTDCGAFCTYTQGYYGNDGGTSTYIDASGCVNSNTYNAISAAINAFGENISGIKTITFGGGSSKLVLQNTDADIKKVIELLPGGGTSGAIGGDYTMQNIGSLNNSLLAQTITLALNLGLNKGGNMLGYPLQSKFLKTEKARDCGKNGGYGTFDCADFSMINNDIDIDGTSGLTINDVWLAANKLLAGESVGNVDYSTMTAIVDGLNKAWDECRISIEWSDSKASCGQAYTLANNGIESVAFPNPFVSKVNISFTSLASGNATIQLFDITGRKLGFIYRPNVIAGTKNIVEYNVPLNSPSVIFYRVTIGDKFATGKVIAASRL